LGDIITTGGAGWNVGEVTVAVLAAAAESPDGLTQASIINAARNLNFRPTLLREGMNYIMNGEEDAYYSQDIQILQYDAAAGYFTDIGEPYSFETSTEE
jgi:branched-chain amino acid transport system substrate-binding protein